MKEKELLLATAHRPYPYPTDGWTMKQVWRELLFAHWPLDPELVAPTIPRGLELDVRDGTAWLSLVPFEIRPLRFRGFPPVPTAGSFLEFNVRTYVVRDGKPGVFFYSLDASSRLAVEAARRMSMRYLNAAMGMRPDNGGIVYEVTRTDKRGQPAVFRGVYRPTDTAVFQARPGTLLHWLSERYRLYTVNKKGEALTGDIHHLPWPLQYAELSVERNTMAESHGFRLPEVAPLLTYTKRIDVLLWPIRKL